MISGFRHRICVLRSRFARGGNPGSRAALACTQPHLSIASIELGLARASQPGGRVSRRALPARGRRHAPGRFLGLARLGDRVRFRQHRRQSAIGAACEVPVDQQVAACERRGTAYTVLKLPDVPWEIMLRKRRKRRGRQRQLGIVLGVESAQELVSEPRDVSRRSRSGGRWIGTTLVR